MQHVADSKPFKSRSGCPQSSWFSILLRTASAYFLSDKVISEIIWGTLTSASAKCTSHQLFCVREVTASRTTQDPLSLSTAVGRFRSMHEPSFWLEKTDVLSLCAGAGRRSTGR